jgi:hypothetical protein
MCVRLGRTLEGEVTRLRTENTTLRTENSCLRDQMNVLTQACVLDGSFHAPMCEIALILYLYCRAYCDSSIGLSTAKNYLCHHLLGSWARA